MASGELKKDLIVLTSLFVVIPLVLVLIGYFVGVVGAQYAELLLTILTVALLFSIYEIRKLE
jgi:antibiotic biosynthesis monooxygenase (ABM) superfamily enzyme